MKEEKPPKVAILLSVYNGEKWISELLNSIALQRDIEFDLIWRDDSSTDLSIKRVTDFPRISKIQCQEIKENIGAAQSFIHLLSHAKDYDYVAFCDQDDVWDPDKLSIAIEYLSSTPDTPSVYASKVRIMNQNINWPIVKYETSIVNAVFENVFLGCTVVLNKSASNIVMNTRFPTGLMHDSWIYCISAFSMKVYFDNDPHMDYRLHKNNDTGVRAIKPFISISTLVRLSTIFEVRNQANLKIKELCLASNELKAHSDQVQILHDLRNPSYSFRISRFRLQRFRQNNLENFVFRILWALKFF